MEKASTSVLRGDSMESSVEIDDSCEGPQKVYEGKIIGGPSRWCLVTRGVLD